MQRPGHISFTGTELQPKYRKWDACARRGGQQSVAPITTEPDPLDRLSSVHRVTLSHQFPVIVSTVVPNLFIFVLEKKYLTTF